MTEGKRTMPSAVGTPPAEGSPSLAPMDQLHIMQYLMEIQKELSAVSTKTDRITSDLSKVDEHVGDLKAKVSTANTILKTAGVLFPIFGIFLWWLIGSEFTQLKNDMLHRQPVEQASPAPAPN